MKNGYNEYFENAKKNSSASGTSSKVNKTAKGEKLTAEQYLREALKTQQKNKKPRQKTPWPAIFVIVAGLCLAALGHFNPDKFEEVISRVEFKAFSLVSAAETAEKSGATKGDSAANSSGAPAGQTQGVCPEPKGYTEEELSHFNKLNERKKQLDLREAELLSMEEELHKQRKEVEARILKLEHIREEVAGVLKERVEVDEQRVATLVDFYSNMKPKQAADIITTLNEDLAVEVLGKMKKKNAADILNLLEPTKARAISEKFTGYKRR